MIEIEEFFVKLKESIEEHSVDLQAGKLFGPQFLGGRVFSNTFQKVAQTLEQKLALKMLPEQRNDMPEPADLYGSWQQVDYVYFENNTQPNFFLELESLDRAQLYLFCDIDSDKIDENNKLWYYLGTIKKHVDSGVRIPRYFVWLLILPDRKVADYSANLWDIKTDDHILHPSLKNLIFENPYLFYDHLIKTSARLFLEESRNELNDKCLRNYQDNCELVFLTCTGDRLIMSRGKDDFRKEAEKTEPIKWK